MNAVLAAALLPATTQGQGADVRQPAVERVVARLDSAVPQWLERFHVPGVAVAVVRRDTTVLLRGWGSAEAGGSRRVTPRTAFRVASLSKLITATAALRLVEEGRLDLHADVARYLETDIPRRFPGGVTLHRLLTHTAGFDLSDVGDATRNPDEVIPLRLLVSSDPEPQVLPPGLAHHYSNFGFALIGHVIERVAQIDFAEYVRRAVLAPLEMGSSTFEQPPPPAIRDQLAVGHAWSGSGYRRLPLDYTHVGPADALITTASDMAAFIRFQLGHGSVVLSQPTRDRMHATQFVASPSPYGMAYGFEENVMSKRRVLQHGGAQLGFNSIVVLFPEDDLGVFVAQNAREGNLRSSMLHVIAEELLDARDALQALPPGRPDSTLDASRYTGKYRHTGYTHSTFEKAASILGFRGSSATVEPGAQPGTLRIDGGSWIHAPALGEHMFVNAERRWWVKGFIVGADGRATHHVAGKDVLERLSWWEHKRTVQVTIMLTMLTAFATVVVWPLTRRSRRRRGARPLVGPGVEGGERSAIPEAAAAVLGRRAVEVSALLWIVGIVSFSLIMSIVMNRDVQFDYGPTWELVLMLTLLQLAVVATAFVPIVAALSWRRGWWSVPARLAVTVQGVVSLAAVAALHYMNLTGYRW